MACLIMSLACCLVGLGFCRSAKGVETPLILSGKLWEESTCWLLVKLLSYLIPFRYFCSPKVVVARMQRPLVPLPWFKLKIGRKKIQELFSS